MSSDRNLSEIQRGLRSFEGFFNEEKLIDDILRELFNGERIFITGIRKKVFFLEIQKIYFLF